ncbi:MAG: hypothetical protein AB7I13_16105 [Vicinamibacterales bacterium]
MKTSVAMGMGVWLLAGAAWPALGQEARPGTERQQRYQIGTMERVLEGAVEHGAALTRERLQAVLPADMLLTENAVVRGFRLDGYGMFFDVAVPSLEGTFPWMFQALNQNNLGLDSALRTLRAFIENASPDDADVRQALDRVALQVAPVSAGLTTPGITPGATPASQTAPEPARPAPSAPAPGARILENPQEAYRAEIRDALMDAMLEHSRGLELGPEEWLTVAARSNEVRPRLAPVNTESRTVVIKVRGADLNAFLGGQISRDEARQRMNVRVF